jgi:hypothetical protein
MAATFMRDEGAVRAPTVKDREEGAPLEVRPRYDFFTGRKAGASVELNGDAEGGSTHRAGGLEAFYGLDEAPSGHGAHLDLSGLNERITADDAPAVVERLYHRHLLAEREHELVWQNGTEQLADLAALDAKDRRRSALRGHAGRRAAAHESEERAPPRRSVAPCTQEGDSGDGPRAGERRGNERAGSVGERPGHRPGLAVIA